MKPAPKKSIAARAATLSGYAPFLTAVKDRIRAAQVRAMLSANAQLIYLYWDIGRAIAAMQERKGWGAGVIPRLARDIANEMPEVKGFSERNIDRMVAFAREYPSLNLFRPQPAALLAEARVAPISPTPLAKLTGTAEMGRDPISPRAVAKLAINDTLPILPQLAAKLPWAHNALLIEKLKDPTSHAPHTLKGYHPWAPEPHPPLIAKEEGVEK